MRQSPDAELVGPRYEARDALDAPGDLGRNRGVVIDSRREQPLDAVEHGRFR
jgi:hypothetical protein